MSGLIPACVSIPQDVVYHIVEHCRDDVPTLQKCAVVSRYWVPMAQRHLLSSIAVDNDCPKRNLPSFLDCFIEHSSTSCAYIRSLRMKSGRCSSSELFGAVRRLTNLRTLHIDSMDILPSNTFSYTFLANDLESLDINACKIYEFDRSWRPLFDLIHIFPFIKQLRLNNLWIRDSEYSSTAISLFSLRKTHIDSMLLSPSLYIFRMRFVDLLVKSVDTENVESLTLTPWYYDDAKYKHLQRLLDGMSKLESLWLDIYGLGSLLDPFSLALCHSLENIKFRTICHYRWDRNLRVFNPNLHGVLAILASLPQSSPLATVMLQIQLSSVNCNPEFMLGGVDWSELGPVLQRFKELETLNISFLVARQIQPPTPSADLLAFVRNELDDISRRCTLQLEWNILD